MSLLLVNCSLPSLAASEPILPAISSNCILPKIEEDRLALAEALTSKASGPEKILRNVFDGAMQQLQEKYNQKISSSVQEKAFCSRYLESERYRCIQQNLPITITEIIPGWVNSLEDPDYKKHNPKAYWVDSLQDATEEAFQAIKNKVPVAYVTKRWEKVAEILKIMPDDLYNAIGEL